MGFYPRSYPTKPWLVNHAVYFGSLLLRNVLIQSEKREIAHIDHNEGYVRRRARAGQVSQQRLQLHDLSFPLLFLRFKTLARCLVSVTLGRVIDRRLNPFDFVVELVRLVGEGRLQDLQMDWETRCHSRASIRVLIGSYPIWDKERSVSLLQTDWLVPLVELL